MFTWTVSFIIIVAIAITTGIYLNHKFYNDDSIGIIVGMVIVMAFLICTIIFGFSADINGGETNTRYADYNKTFLYSIEDNQSIEGQYLGSFILGYGSINSNMYYYSLVGNDIDGYLVKKYDASEVYVVPDENNKPYYIEKVKIYDYKYKDNWFYGGIIKQFKIGHNEVIIKKELHLPKNYIKMNYNIDLK